MTFLGPFALSTWALLAGGAAALAIIAYILKMRRRRFEVPFSTLWQRVLEQRDANAWWKQLRRWVSLAIALTILALLFLAMRDPTLGAHDRDARSVVVIVDASASMATRDGGPDGDTQTSRLEAAKAQAKSLVDGMGGGDVALILRLDGQATPLSRFSSDVPRLRQAIDGIQISETPADLTRALGAATDALRDRQNPLIVLVSDGAFSEAELALAHRGATAERLLASVDLGTIDLRYLPVGRQSDNVGIIAFNVRRYVANKAAYEVFVELQNFGATPARRQLALYNGETAVDVKDLTFAPGQRLRQIYRELPGGEDNRLRATLRAVPGEGGADAFSLDDEAFALIPARKRQRVLLVTADNLYLEGAILVYDNVEPAKLSPTEYDADPSVAANYDAVFFDEHTPKVLPPAPTHLVFFHPTGPSAPFTARASVTRPRITDLADAHPVMRWITMADVNFDQADAYVLDRARGDVALATAVRDVIVAARREPGRKVVAFGFSLPGVGRAAVTDLPMRVAFPLLLVNVLDWFAGDEGEAMTTYATGQRHRVSIDGATDAMEALIETPAKGVVRSPILDGLASFYPERVGFYRVAAVAKPAPGEPSVAPARLPSEATPLELAANLSSASESDIAPSRDLTIAGAALTAPEAFKPTRSRKLWLYAVLLVVAILFIEWVTYHRRVTI